MKKNEHMSKLFISSLKNNTYIIYFQSIKCCLLQTTWQLTQDIRDLKYCVNGI